MKKIITYILYFISFSSILLASGIRDVSNWWELAKPFFAVWFITCFLALTLSYSNQIRRVSYPSLVCLNAWLYKYRILHTNFARSTYRLYKHKGNSYSNLFDYVQELFDLMYE